MVRQHSSVGPTKLLNLGKPMNDITTIEKYEASFSKYKAYISLPAQVSLVALKACVVIYNIDLSGD